MEYLIHWRQQIQRHGVISYATTVIGKQRRTRTGNILVTSEQQQQPQEEEKEEEHQQ